VQDEDASRELVPSDYVVKAADEGIWDSYATKRSALQLAVDAALTVMRIDMIIMSKPAGGPKPRQMAGTDSIDDD
jgi:T-complex protein 1 subunit theta